MWYDGVEKQNLRTWEELNVGNGLTRCSCFFKQSFLLFCFCNTDSDESVGCAFQ